MVLGGIFLGLVLKWNRTLAREVSERKKSERALQKEKDFIETVINSIPDAISIIDIDTGCIVEANEAFISEVGLPWEEIEGRFCYEVTHNLKDMCGPPYHECPMLKTSETGRKQVTEHTHHDKEGNEIYAEVSTFPIKDENGTFTQVVHVSRDITERKKAEGLIRDSEERLTQIINFLPDPTWVVDNEGKVVIWNRALEKLTGSKADDMVGKGNYEYALPFYGERRPVLIDLVRDWSEEYEKEYLSIKKEEENLVAESFHPDLGHGNTYLLATAGLLYDASGEATGAIESLRDITAMKEAEIELQKLSRAIEQSPTAVVVTDLKGTIEYVNPKFTDLTGYSAKEAIGKNPRVLKSGKHPREYYKNLWDTILSGKEWHGELCNRNKNGDLFWEYASISPVRNAEGEITHFVAVKEDITKRKQMRQELIEAKRAADEANMAKGDFLANMSHEIRTPMNAVIGMSHLALKTELTPKQRDYLNKIQSSANALLGIINDILDFSKIEAGKLDMESVDFNLDDVLENIANLVTVRAQKKENIEVLFSTAANVPRFLKGDPLRLGQVLINLSNNAVKFTDSGEIVISSQIVKEDKDRFTLQFSVSDTGVGLTQEQISRLFQAFTQADTSTTRKFGGTGLGLTISKRLVEMMAGEIWVESEHGKGSTFIFTAVFGRGSEKEKKQLVPSPDLRGIKVLVVDDNATSRNIFQEMLESFTFKTTLAASGEEGLEELEKAPGDDPFKLVIMDWQMPGMDGIEASERIKEMPHLDTPPAIVMVTAYGREEIMQKVEQANLDGFLIKPVSPSVLFDTIMQALGEILVKQPDMPSAAEEELRVLDLIRGARILLVEDNEINRQVAREILKGAGL
ncbi:MAG: PAS domain S-box protein, partial [Deltaproteobacteria bacterium]|nr:PAS domain S-box protein [Deltaproteobacteria bacterium]